MVTFQQSAIVRRVLRLGALALLALLPTVARAQLIQMGSLYQQAASAFLQAAARCANPSGAACMRQNAAYNQCLASQFGNSSTNCVAPTCSTSCVGSAPAAGSSPDGPTAAGTGSNASNPGEAGRITWKADPRAVLNQLREMESADLSDLMSGRRIEAAAIEEESAQLDEEVPKELDFNHPETLPDEVPGVTVLDLSEPDALQGDGVSEIDFQVAPPQPACLTLDGCLEQEESASDVSGFGWSPDQDLNAAPPDTSSATPSGATTPEPMASNGVGIPKTEPEAPFASATPGRPASEATPESDNPVVSAVSALKRDVQDYYEGLRSDVNRAVSTQQQFTRDTAKDIVDAVPAFLAGQLDSTHHYTGSIAERIADNVTEGTGDSAGTLVGGFLTYYVGGKVQEAIDNAGERAVAGDDTASRLEYVFRKDILLNVGRGSEMVDGIEKMFGIVLDDLDKDPEHRR